jgi:ATP-binding cassette, subfamily B, bacterial PglK
VTRRRQPRQTDLPTVLTSTRRSWDLLTRAARRRYAVIVLGQMATGVLDLLGVALIGLMGLAATSAVSGNADMLDSLPLVDRLDEADPLALAAALAVFAAVALLARSFAYGFLLRMNYRLLARSQVETTSDLLRQFLRLPLTQIQDSSSQAAAYALTSGAAAAISGILGSLSIVLTDSTLLVLIGGALLVWSPVVTLVAAAYLGLVAVGVHLLLSRWSARVGAQIGTAGVANIALVQEGIGLHRELWALGRLGQQYAMARASLESGAVARATQGLIAQVPRVVYDTALVIGALLLAAWQLRVSSLAEAMSMLLVFLAAAARVIPSLLRVNGQLINMRASAAQSRQTYELADRLRRPAPAGWEPPTLEPVRTQVPDGPTAGAHLVVRDVTFTYPAGPRPVLSCVSLEAAPGESVAIVGPTGGGKSTLADVIVGLLTPQRGVVAIDDRTPADQIASRPGCLAYVPQRVMLVEGTVRDNVCVGLRADEIDDDLIWDALRQAHVDDVVAALPEGLGAHIGEHGLRLSGGQRQRVGLARALYSRPSLLVLDEATSALDAETEQLIASGLSALRGSVTVVVIAHRLAAVKGADRVVYLEDGQVSASGSFDALLQESPAFARQVHILSLPATGGPDA